MNGSLKKIALTPSKPLLCLEVNPPRGVDIEPVLTRLGGEVLQGIDFLNITDSALARMKLAALPFGAILKQRFAIEPLVNLSCRDRNVIALQADLLAAWALGVRSVVALTGDAVSVGDAPDSKGVFEVNSIGLLHAIKTLNEGRDLVGNALKGAPQFVAGVVVNPNARNVASEVRRLKKKKDAGAQYALSQPVFDLGAAIEFLKLAAEVEIPIFLGLLPLKSASAAKSISNVPGIRISEEVVARIAERQEDDLSEFFLAHCLQIAQETKGLVAGYHVISGVTPGLAIELSKRLSAWIQKG